MVFFTSAFTAPAGTTSANALRARFLMIREGIDDCNRSRCGKAHQRLHY
jgi:hypothetical protein